MTGNFVSLYKTRKKEDTSVLKLKCSWISGELNLLVTDGNTAWNGKFSSEEIESFCDVLGITRDEYITECQQAFSGGESAENFLFTVENDRFVWRKELDANTKVKFGSLKLSPIPLVQALEEFVDFAFEAIERCRQEVTNAKNKMGYFERERTTLVQKIEEYTQNKKEIENTLYSKFLYVLNSKKERIAVLEQELLDLKSKIQQSTTESESHKCDTAVVTEPSSHVTREMRKPYHPRVRRSAPSVAADAELQGLLNIPVGNNDTQTSSSSTSQQLKNKRNMRQKGQQRTKTNPSHKKEESYPCTSKAFVEQACKPDVLENTVSTQHQPSKNDTEQKETLIVRSASPVASTSTSVVPLENNIPVKYDTPGQFVREKQGTCRTSQSHADQKLPPLAKRGVDDLVSEQIKDVAGAVYSSEAKDKTVWKISEVICPIDLVSQKTDISSNNVKTHAVPKNNKKIVTSPAKLCKEFEIISPLDMLVQPKSRSPSLVHKDTVCVEKNSSLKRPMQSMNMRDNNSHEFSTEGRNVCQEAVASCAEGAIVNDVNTDSSIHMTDATAVTVSSVNHTKSQTEGESNHYDSETDVDEPEDICKLSAKHRSVNGVLEDSYHSSFTESENPLVTCNETHQPEQKTATEHLLNDSQDTDCASEEVPMAALPKRTRRSERINKSVPVINKSRLNHFTKLTSMQDKYQNVSQNMHSVLYEQETQIADTQKLLDDLG